MASTLTGPNQKVIINRAKVVSLKKIAVNNRVTPENYSFIRGKYFFFIETMKLDKIIGIFPKFQVDSITHFCNA